MQQGRTLGLDHSKASKGARRCRLWGHFLHHRPRGHPLRFLNSRPALGQRVLFLSFIRKGQHSLQIQIEYFERSTDVNRISLSMCHGGVVASRLTEMDGGFHAASAESCVLIGCLLQAASHLLYLLHVV